MGTREALLVRLELSLWQANRFALDDRSLADSLGSTGPGQYEAGPSELQVFGESVHLRR